MGIVIHNCHLPQLFQSTWSQLSSISVPLVALGGPLVLANKCVLSNWLLHAGSMHN